MADGNAYIDEIEAALKAAQQQTPATATPAPQTGTALTPSLPVGQPDYQSEIANALSAPLPTTGAVTGVPGPEQFGPPFPTAPYSALDKATNTWSLGLADRYRALTMAADRYHTGQTPDFNYPQALEEVKLGREAYAAANPITSLAADVMGTLVSPASRLAGTAIKAAPTLAKLPVSAATGGLIGGVQGGLDAGPSTDDMLQGATTGAEWGAVTGAAVPAVSYVGGKMFPAMSPEMQALRGAGVNVTPGTIGGVPSAAESLFSHIPIVGAPIKAAQAAAREQLTTATTDLGTLNRDAINQSLAKIGETLDSNTPAGYSAIQELQTKLSNAYKKAVPTAGGTVDTQALADIRDALANANLNLNPTEEDAFRKFVQNRILGNIQGATLSGPDFQNIDQALGDNAHKFLKANNPYQNDLGDAYLNLQGKLREWLQRVSPANAADLQAANEAWRLAKPVQMAARATNDPQGIFSLDHLRSAIRSASPTSQFAAGNAPMQKFVNDTAMQTNALTEAGNILPGKGSGLADLAGHAATGTALGTAIMEDPQRAWELARNPWVLGGIGAGYLGMRGAYSDFGRRNITGLLGKIGQVPPAFSSFGPVGAQVVTVQPGLLNYNNQ